MPDLQHLARQIPLAALLNLPAGTPCGLQHVEQADAVGCAAEHGVASQHAGSGGIGDSARAAKLVEYILALWDEYRNNTKAQRTKLDEQSLVLRYVYDVSVLPCPRHTRKSWQA